MVVSYREREVILALLKTIFLLTFYADSDDIKLGSLILHR